MSWTDIFPVLDDAMLEAYRGGVSDDERLQFEQWFGVERKVAASNVAASNVAASNVAASVPLDGHVAASVPLAVIPAAPSEPTASKMLAATMQQAGRLLPHHIVTAI